jgi:predicted helicase
MPILAITGNPPYSGHSRNKGKWISNAIDAYKKVDGKPLGEKNPKWLNDDYVKFIRFAQMKMDGGEYNVYGDDGSVSVVKFDGVKEGVVGIITNHSFLDNPTFRGMRQSLMASFNQIYIINLHGNSKKKETAPDGSKDENVFDIQQGVSISLFTKKPGLKRSVFHADYWGKRLDKYKATAETTFKQVRWQKLVV